MIRLARTLMSGAANSMFALAPPRMVTSPPPRNAESFDDGGTRKSSFSDEAPFRHGLRERGAEKVFERLALEDLQHSRVTILMKHHGDSPLRLW